MKQSLKISFKKEEKVLECLATSSIGDVKAKISQIYKIPFLQIQLSYTTGEGVKQTLSDANLAITKVPTKNWQLKDLGKQIRWSHVFYVEYFGPLLIMSILYWLGDRQRYSNTQWWCWVLSSIHYAKREYQTAFVHVFSRESMPFSRVIINSLHYWVLFATLVGIELFLCPVVRTMGTFQYLLMFVWIACQLLNFLCHRQLASFRKGQNCKNRGIPFGYGFQWVSCANYFWEIGGWVAFSLISHCWTAWLFTVVSTLQMTDWAIKKHKAYHKQFSDKYPRARKAIIPFIL